MATIEVARWTLYRVPEESVLRRPDTLAVRHCHAEDLPAFCSLVLQLAGVVEHDQFPASRHFSDIRGLHCICDRNEGHKSHSFHCGKLLMSDTNASPRNSRTQLQQIAAIFACAVRRHRQDCLNKVDSGEEVPTGVDLSAETRLSVSHGEDDRELS